MELLVYNSGSMPTISGQVGFGEFELDLETGELRKSGTILKLQPQPASVLCLLVSEAGKLVSREDIRRRLWGESTFVDYDVGVDYCVNRIRSVLCDKAHAPRYIETLPRRGYRFIAPVKRRRPFAEPTLAVLPFANLNGDPDREYFADGVTDALVTERARIPTVRVISRQSVLHLKGSSRKLDEIARDLGVDGVVEGAALHEGNRVRLTAQLILMEPERHAWAQTYECDMSAVLLTQREAARAIAACVATALRSTGAVAPASIPAGPEGAWPRGRPAPEILEAYLKARFELEKASAEGLVRALQYFREITLKAPDFAPGLAWHSACLMALGFFGHAPSREVFPSAKQLALQAVAADDSLSEAHQVLAWMNWLLDWDLAAAEQEFRRAIELSPSNPLAHDSYGTLLSCTARHSEAIAEAQYALRLNPTSLLPNQVAAWFYIQASQDAQAEAHARRTIEFFPDSLQPHFVLGWATWRQGRAEEAVAAFEKALSLSREALSLSFLGHVYARLGRRDEAMRLLRELEQLFAQGRASPIAFGVLYAGLGDADAALEWLETAYRLRCDIQYLTTGFPGIDPLRSDPRFADLVRRMGIVPP
jgi:TolB-like protein/Tfp pilus assembly protein PilF